jgi:predicted nucleic acid-binding Zn ribbon protein
MAKYCRKCGIELPLGSRYCLNCGKRTEPIEKRKKLLIIVSIIIVALIVIGVLFLFILQDDTGKFIGTWKVEASTGGSDYLWTFYENGTLKTISLSSLEPTPSITCIENETENTLTVVSVNISSSDYPSVQWGTFNIEDNKLYLSTSAMGGYEGSPMYGFDYEFSDNDHITLTLGGYPIFVTLNRTSEQDYNLSQSIDAVEWKNINISLYGPSTIHWDWINLTRSSVKYTETTAPTEWGNVTVGDTLQIGKYNATITVYMEWVPSSGVIGYWYFSD